jgi:hypothetical protein
MWSFTVWGILTLTVEKARKDAHLLLLPLTFMAVVAVGIASLVAAFVVANTTRGTDAIAFAVMFAGLALYALHFLANEAVKTWRGIRTRFN